MCKGKHKMRLLLTFSKIPRHNARPITTCSVFRQTGSLSRSTRLLVCCPQLERLRLLAQKTARLALGARTLKASTAPSPFECCTVGFCDRLQLVLEILRTKVKHSAPLVLHQSAVNSLRDSTATDAVKFLVEDVHSPLLRIRSLLGLSWGSPADRWHRQPGPLRRSQSQPLHAAPH